ncbi:CCA tRNA nucleotidyltransferase [Salinispora arenicola]|uniref:CCA tRNA nucleotidyltransferase n=2 Tax=Salinispora arenicola TaxID=168697 RepID=A0A542XK86_SALAC|nr:CCA tRNA nucleotidyltransferase [Salinispora arenicola]MCN0153238.1 CCA tRNA nucleotidyltransferase [Salinispora arenicola]NIL58756.1 CCA tRNA nucleotidyltransferase [Salinispora arenicola]NIL64439.1 CCA tRNA nucleotidyltransferase [Salinispora arenicola]TQL36237.1 poly(A) polymerase [Salinispora arenicola]GIM83936.1 CCA tRNA nucleotidyltransferase [Salinispora arenicola]
MSDAAPNAADRRELTAAQRTAVTELLRVSPVADELGRRFVAAGHELHLVGGSVRDALLGRLGDDLDFCTDAHPDQTLQIVRGWAEAVWETGREFGTIGVQRDGLRLEITTFRAEVYDQVSRNPVVQYGTSLTEDLKRRDFTVNAMAVSVPDHRFTDPHGGLADLATKVVRTPSAPEESFRDDPLRMLRAARFAAQLRFAVHPDVRAAMTRMATDLDRITAERIRDEFTKLLCGADPVTGLRLLVDSGLAERFLPELTGLKLEIDEHAQHKDVYEHTLTVVRNAVSYEEDGCDFVLRMAALMHDVGKPATKAVGPDGRVSFHHHEVVGARLTKARMKALRFPREAIAKVTALVALHLRFYGYGRGEWTDSAVRRYVADAGDLLPRLHKLTRSDCTTRNRRKAAQLAADYDALEERIARIAAEEDLARVRPDLDGNAIMKLLGVPPGPVVGLAWKHLKELRLERGPLGRDEAEAELLRWAREQGVVE